MLYLEFKRSIHNKTIIYLMIVTAVAFIMGWALPAGLENIKKISPEYYYFSTYTVFTQFGFLLFSFVTANFFNKEFRDKNTLFYRYFRINSFKFYYLKLGLLYFEELLCIAVCLLVVSFVFHTFSLYFGTLFVFSIVVLQYFMIVGIFSMLLNNMLVSLGLSIVYWLITVVMITFGGVWKILAVFDASNGLYDYMEKYFRHTINFIPAQYIGNIALAFTILITLSIAVNFFTRKSWVKKGL